MTGSGNDVLNCMEIVSKKRSHKILNVTSGLVWLVSNLLLIIDRWVYCKFHHDMKQLFFYNKIFDYITKSATIYDFNPIQGPAIDMRYHYPVNTIS